MRAPLVPKSGTRIDSSSVIPDSISSMLDEAGTTADSDVNTRIAANVRALRGLRGLSLEALAARCGVSRSMLSLIERGESSPTASLLDRVAVGLGVALASLFDSPHGSSGPLSRRSDRRPWRDPQSGYVRRNISPPGHASALRIVEVLLPARAHVAYENGPELALQQQIWVQLGRVDVTVGSEVYRLSEDDCLAMQLDEPTAFRNPGRRAARYIVVIAPGRPRAARL
jgi:transcriptional regulator with XRE-family HTH domain